MTIHSLGHCHFYLKSLLTVLTFLNYGNNQIFYQSTKKNDKRNFENHRSISLLPIFSKVFENAIVNKTHAFLQNEQLLNPSQSGFLPSDSCTNQLLSITHKIFQSFNATPPLEVKSVFFRYIKSL